MIIIYIQCVCICVCVLTCMWSIVLSMVWACSKVTVHPPKPPPVIRLPNTPSTSMAADTSSSSSLQLTSYRSLTQGHQVITHLPHSALNSDSQANRCDAAALTVPQGVVALHHKLAKLFVGGSLQGFGGLGGSFNLLNHMTSSSIGHIIQFVPCL